MALIYIVEDDKNIAEIEEFALKNSGFEVYTFSNAKDFDKKMENKKKFNFSNDENKGFF